MHDQVVPENLISSFFFLACVYDCEMTLRLDSFPVVIKEPDVTDRSLSREKSILRDSVSARGNRATRSATS